MMNLNAIMKI